MQAVYKEGSNTEEGSQRHRGGQAVTQRRAGSDTEEDRQQGLVNDSC